MIHSIRFTFHDVGGGREMICRDRGSKNGRYLNHSIVVVYFFSLSDDEMNEPVPA
jgi:pSer/pThr/pTyr-binding forkhead associated (FHA) protein